MKHFLKVFLIFTSVLTITLTAQTVHQVAEGTGGIYTAIMGAASGDIIELTTSGGQYIEDSTLVIDFGLTVRAADGLEAQPVLFTNSVHFFHITANLGLDENNYWLNLEGITTDGMRIDGSDSTITGGEIVNIADGATYHCIKIEGCTMQNMYSFQYDGGTNWGNHIIGNSNAYTDSVIFRNNIAQHWSTPYGGDLLFFRGDGLAGDILIEDCTVWDAGVFLVDIKEGTNAAISQDVVPKVLIQNVTISGMTQPWAGGSIITQNAVIKNIIHSNNEFDGIGAGFLEIGGVGTVMSHCLTDSVWPHVLKDTDAVIDSANMQWMTDVLFKDALNGDFTLLEGSPAIGAADDGGNLGDPRWNDPTGIEVISSTVPESYSLSQNYPNPFNPTTNIQFSIPESGLVTLRVFDVLGQQVAELVNQELSVGVHKVDFDASELTSGIFFYTLESGNFVQTNKMILLK